MLSQLARGRVCADTAGFTLARRVGAAATTSCRCVGRSTALTISRPLVTSTSQSLACHGDVSAHTIRTASVLAARSFSHPMMTCTVMHKSAFGGTRADVPAFSTLAAVVTPAIRERGWVARGTDFSAVTATAVAAVLAGVGIATCESGEKPKNGGELARVVARGDHTSVRRLLAGGTDVNERHPAGWTPLHAAAVRGDGDLCEILLAAGADPNAEDT